MKAKKHRKFNLHEIYVHFGMFDFGVSVVVGKDAAEAYKYAAWQFEHGADSELVALSKGDLGGARGRCFRQDGYTPIIWIPRFPVTPREYGTLCHEALHVVRYMIQEWACMPFSEDSEEGYCHAVGYLVTKVLEAKPALNRKGK